MKIKHWKPFLLLYITVVVLDLIAVVAPIKTLEYIAKPSLMMVLGAFFYLNVQTNLNRLVQLILAALFFSWGGDVFLLLVEAFGENFFLLGLGSFLIAHLCYIAAFTKTTYPKQKSKLFQNLWLGGPILMYGVGLLALLGEHLGDLLIPVIVYGTAIMCMGWASLYRLGKVSYESFLWVFAGALAFILSDSLIALNKFYETIPYASFWIMLLYTTSQYLIVIGILKQEKS